MKQKPTARPRRWLLASLIAVALAVGVAMLVWRDAASPKPPEIATTGLDRAIAALLQENVSAVKKSPRSGEAWGRLGLVLRNYDFHAEARFCLDQAERFSPREARWAYFHGLVWLPEQAEAGLAKLRRAAELAGESTDVPRLKLAETLTERGALDEAELHLKELLRRRVDHPMALLGSAKAAFARGRLDEVTTHLRGCLADQHTARAAYLLLGAAQQKLGNAPAAQGAARIASTLSPDADWPDAYANEAARLRAGRQAWVDEAQHLLRAGRVEAALPLVTRVVTDYPEAADGWLLLGRARLLQKKFAAAEEALRRCLDRAPESVDALMQLGLVLARGQRHTEAAEYFQRAAARKPDYAEAHLNLGLAQLRAGRETEALAALREAVRVKPEFVEPYLPLADLLARTSRAPEAVKLLQQALELNPAEPRVKKRLEQLGKPSP